MIRRYSIRSFRARSTVDSRVGVAGRAATRHYRGMKMRLISFAVVAGAIMTPARSLSSQQSTDIDPVSVSPDKYKILLENDYVRVVEYSIKAGERDRPHTHPPKVSYVASGGSLRIT